MATNTCIYNNERIFLSYQWDNQFQVLQLRNFLINKGYDSWMDIHEILPGSNLTDRIATAILSSDIFIACITKKYVKSDMCNKEIHYASKNKKFIIPLLYEDLNDKELKGIGLLISTLLHIQLFKDPLRKLDWSGEISEQLLNSIERVLNGTQKRIIEPKVVTVVKLIIQF